MNDFIIFKVKDNNNMSLGLNYLLDITAKITDKYFAIIGINIIPSGVENYLSFYENNTKDKSLHEELLKIIQKTNDVNRSKNANLFNSNVVVILISDLQVTDCYFRDLYWRTRSFFIAADFKTASLKSMHQRLIQRGMQPSEKSKIRTLAEEIGFFLDDEIERTFSWYKPDGLSNIEIVNKINEEIDIHRWLKRSLKALKGELNLVGVLGSGHAFAMNHTDSETFYFLNDNEYIIVFSSYNHISAANLELKGLGKIPPLHMISIFPNNSIVIGQTVSSIIQEMKNSNDFFSGGFEEIFEYGYNRDRGNPEKYQFKSTVKGIPNSLQLAFQQYLLFFREYVEAAKNKSIEFDVNRKNGQLEIILKVDKYDEVGEFENYLHEYLQFAKGNLDKPIEVEGSPSIEDIDLLRLRMNQQVTNLNMEIQFRDYKIDMLEKNLTRVESDKTKFIDMIASSFHKGSTKSRLNREKNKLYKIISGKNLSEVFDLIEEEISLLELFNPSEFYAIRGRWVNLSNKINNGLINFDDQTHEENRIRKSLLNFLN